jgi:hypothetical protein
VSAKRPEQKIERCGGEGEFIMRREKKRGTYRMRERGNESFEQDARNLLLEGKARVRLEE